MYTLVNPTENTTNAYQTSNSVNDLRESKFLSGNILTQTILINAKLFLDGSYNLKLFSFALDALGIIWITSELCVFLKSSIFSLVRDKFDGSKSVILTTTSWLEGKTHSWI